MNTYPAYKNSGSSYLARVPNHWEVCHLKNIVSCNDEVLSENTDPEFEFDYVDISNVSLEDGIKLIQRIKFKNAPSRARRRARNKDIIISTVRTYLKAIAVVNCREEDNLIVSTGFAVLRSKNIVNSKYVGYFVQHQKFIEQVCIRSNGVSYPAINASELIKIPALLPPISEQQAIVDYLDRETAEMDALITEQKELVSLLKQKRSAIISETVCRGLDPTVPMKDSGVKWLGMVPEEWNVSKLGLFVKKIESGVSVNGAPYPVASNQQFGILKTSCVSTFQFRPEENKEVNDYEYHRVACPVRKGTLIVSRMNTPELVGACAYSEYNISNLYLPDRLWQVDFLPNIFVKYIWFYLRSIFARCYLASLATGTSSSMQNISQDQFCGIAIVFPSLSKQQAIVDYLDRETSEIDHLITDCESSIHLIKQRRTALISEAVTGKIDVRTV